jgi:putative DNA primase/helicase
MMPDPFNDAFHEAKQALQPTALRELADAPFRCLGHDRGRFYFYTTEGKQVVTMTARDLHSAGDLAKLARLSWWEGAYPGRESFSVKAAGDALIRACYAAGVYDPDRLRGRGIWLDDGRTVLHLGHRLIVDGAAVAIQDFETGYIYEQARPMAIDLAEAASDDEARRLLTLCSGVAWEQPSRDGHLLAGWIVAAMLCGAMAWRPHLWLVSEAGGGKSWVLDNIIKPTLRAMAVQVQSKTTEAGIRGELGSDARPIVFDEAEGQNDADRARIQHVLDLARQASSEDGGAIVKGTQAGGSKHYRIRSCFVFASINLGLVQAADESRTIPLAIGAGTPQQFTDIKALHAETMTPGFPARLLARSLRLIPVIRANAETLADAISRTGAGRRAGDTIGTVLAGALSLVSGRTLTAADADALIAQRSWIKEAAEAAKPQPEWQRAMARLMQHGVRYTSRNGRPETATVSELIGAQVGPWGDETIGVGDADIALRRMGMRVMGDTLLIGNRSEGVAGAFRGSPWDGGWAATLARVPGAARNKPARFTPAYQDKALAIPLAVVMEDSL